MMRIVAGIVLVVLWLAWAYFFIGVARLGYALTGSVLPELPNSHYSLGDLVDWVEAVAALYGSPLLLAILSWRFFKNQRRLGKIGDAA